MPRHPPPINPPLAHDNRHGIRIRRDENRSEPGQDIGDAQDRRPAGGRTGPGVQRTQVRFGRVLDVRGHGIHGHHIPSGGHVQNGPGTRRTGRRRPDATGVRRGRAPGGGRVHHADDRPGQHERPDHNDRGKGVGHDQRDVDTRIASGQLERTRLTGQNIFFEKKNILKNLI